MKLMLMYILTGLSNGQYSCYFVCFIQYVQFQHQCSKYTLCIRSIAYRTGKAWLNDESNVCNFHAYKYFILSRRVHLTYVNQNVIRQRNDEMNVPF